MMCTLIKLSTNYWYHGYICKYTILCVLHFIFFHNLALNLVFGCVVSFELFYLKINALEKKFTRHDTCVLTDIDFLNAVRPYLREWLCDLFHIKRIPNINSVIVLIG